MADLKSRADLAYEESVWATVARDQGLVGAACRQAYRDRILRMRALRIDTDAAAALVADARAGYQARFASGLAAFKILTSTIERLGDVFDGHLDRGALVDLLLETKLRMAEIYHELAGIADHADVPDLPCSAETAELVADCRAELEQARAANAPG
ncbi:MAG: hypothetical protein CSA66_05315 [Proteobacteria bacterium]|nr:MAG: hypothetical protein CSA66_05315 [Pseudomonadota bacterium]